jgi:hypothetical protein
MKGGVARTDHLVENEDFGRDGIGKLSDQNRYSRPR